MIFPDWSSTAVGSGSKSLPLYTEWAIDWDSGGFALRNGQPYLVTGDEALRIWVRCALHPENARFLYSAHSADYGNRFAELLSGRTEQGILETLLKKEIRETLLVSPYITAVDGFVFSRSGSRMRAAFQIQTVYGDIPTDTEVEVF